MLNDIQCRNAKPRNKLYRLTDSNGLCLEVKPNGVKAWRYRFKLSGKDSIFAIGDYPDISLVDARKKRATARDLVKLGTNPAHDRQLEKIKRAQNAATTFEAVAHEWLALKDWEDVTKARRLNMLQRVIFPKIGALPIKQIVPAHILDVLQSAAKNNGASVSDETKRTLSGIFDLAISTLRADVDPVHSVRKAVPANKTQHKRALPDAEIAQLFRNVDGNIGNFQTVAAFKLMWLTLCRPNEAVEACWAEIDLDKAIWRIAAERMKKRKEHVIPLSSQATKLLRGMRGITGQHTHVFPHRDNRAKPMTIATLRAFTNKLGWGGKYSPHATRTTGSTKLNEMGFSSDWIERQLAHVEKDSVRRTYNHADYLADRARMMQQWADYLDKLKAGAEIVPLRA